MLAPEPVPKVFGGAERLLTGLVWAVNARTEHEAELVSHPSPESSFAEVLASYEFWFGLDASDFDLIVSAKYPTWMVTHPKHHLYLLHPLRGLYDTYHLCAPPAPSGAPDSSERDARRVLTGVACRREVPALFEALHELQDALDPDHPVLAFPGPLMRDVVRALDRIALAPPNIQRYVALSRAAARRPGYLPSWVPVEVSHPPSDLDGLHRGPFESLFTVSRLDAPKRIDLLLEAMSLVDRDIRLRIGGVGPDEELLRQLAASDFRVELLGFLSEAQLVDEYSRALAVPFVPLDEDFGLVALEAAQAGKPVITSIDSGGAREVVHHRRTGLVVEPTASAVAAAIEELVDDQALAQRLGAEGRRRAADVTWEALLASVLGPEFVDAPSRPRRKPRAGGSALRPARDSARRLVVVSTFPIHPRRGGGQLRSFHLYGALTSSFDVEIVSLDAPGNEGVGLWQTFSKRFREYVVPKSAAQMNAEADAARSAGLPVDDILAARHAHLTPAHLVALSSSMTGADAVVLAHPFLAPVVRDLRPDIPMIYDAHNAEVALKRTLLDDSEHAARLVDEVRRSEGLAVEGSILLSYCSPSDLPVLMEEYGAEDSAAIFVPNGVDTRTVPFVSGANRTAARDAWLAAYPSRSGVLRRVAVFVGSWHRPNIEAAEAIVAMAPVLPEVLFLLVGNHCRALERTPLPDNVGILGTVADRTLRSVLSMADVGLNPMLRGGGSNLKVLEYLAAGLPVVSTEVGARGQPIAGDAGMSIVPIDRFAEAIREVVQAAGSDSAIAVAATARRLVESQFDWRVLGDQLATAIRFRLPAMPFHEPPEALLRGQA